MQFQQYYGAESQDIPITVKLTLRTNTNVFTQEIYVFSLKVVSDTYTTKSTESAFTPVRSEFTPSRSASSSGSLNYTPVMTTFGRGGAVIADPFAYVASFIPIGWATSSLPTYNASTILLKIPYVSSVSVSPAGASIEVTRTSSLYLGASSYSITAVEPPSEV